MILIDTSVWVHHFRERNQELQKLLNNGQVICHYFVIGELACGGIKNRAEILSLLRLLPLAVHASHEEVLGFIDKNKLMGRGLGYIDMHLAASALLTGVPLWTFDQHLAETSRILGISYKQ